MYKTQTLIFTSTASEIQKLHKRKKAYIKRAEYALRIYDSRTNATFPQTLYIIVSYVLKRPIFQNTTSNENTASQFCGSVLK